jgi:hypothetical protein
VVDESTRLVGILTLADIAQHHARSGLRGAADEVHRDLVQTLAAISRRPGDANRADRAAGDERERTQARNAAPLRASLGRRPLQGLAVGAAAPIGR